MDLKPGAAVSVPMYNTLLLPQQYGQSRGIKLVKPISPIATLSTFAHLWTPNRAFVLIAAVNY
jgi:hypothetical protein